MTKFSNTTIKMEEDTGTTALIAPLIHIGN